MSNQSQLAFLTKLNDELNRFPNYRQEVANFQAHHLTLTRTAINRGIADALEFEFEGITRQQINSIKKAVASKVGDILRNTAKTIRAMESRTPEGVMLQLSTPYKIRAVFSATGSNRFDKAYKAYRDHLEDFLPYLNRAVADVLGKTKEFEKKEIWNLEHFKFKGVLESQVKDAIDNALATETTIDIAQVNAFLQSRGVSLKVYRDTKTDTMQVFVGSFRANIAEGQVSKSRKKKLQDELNLAIEKLQRDPTFAFATMKGSDSFTDIKRKKTLKTLTDPFKGIGAVTVTTESTEIKHSKTVNKLDKRAGGSTSNRIRRKSLTRKTRVSPASSPLALIMQLNAKLPSVVMQNMREPGLVNKTGRFASSVRVTDIQKTRKGFTSIGYTYMKEPYQVFEKGSTGNWASDDRDPRKLIDRSIREIAQEYALGRFYTRRV